MWAPLVVEVDLDPDQATDVLQRFEAVPMHILFLERASHLLDQAALLGTVWRGEFLAQHIAFDQCGAVAAA